MINDAERQYLTNPTALVIDRGDFACLGSVVGRYFKSSLQVTSTAALKIRADQIDEIVGRNYGIIVLPLTIPSHGSLRIAQLVHELQKPTRLVLHSGTNASKDVLVPLFDHFFPAPMDLDALRLSLSTPIAKRLSGQDVQQKILDVLNTAGCFQAQCD
jgi:hypothetical protein